MERIKWLCDRPGLAYSCAILGSGVLGCTTAAVASLFKPIYGTEMDKWMRIMWVDVSATICHGDTDENQWVGGGRPIYVKSSTACNLDVLDGGAAAWAGLTGRGAILEASEDHHRDGGGGFLHRKCGERCFI